MSGCEKVHEREERVAILCTYTLQDAYQYALWSV